MSKKKAARDKTRFDALIQTRSESSEVISAHGFNIGEQPNRAWLQGTLQRPSGRTTSVRHVSAGEG